MREREKIGVIFMAIQITPEMTVKEINQKYPVCLEVFRKYGIGGCGGPFGPPEPLDFFASAHNVDLPQLIKDLEIAVNSEAPTPKAAPSAPTVEEADEKRMNELYKLFIKAAIVFTLTGGTLWGVVTLTWIAVSGKYSAPYYAMTQAHGHMQTLGWVGLFIMGVAYFVIPKFRGAPVRDSVLAYLSFFLMTAGIAMRGVTQPLGLIFPFNYLNVLSAALEVVAVGCFAFLIVRTSRESKEKHEFYEKYIYASVVYFVALILFNFHISLDMFAAHENVIRPAPNAIYLHLMLVGFIAMMIMGVSQRVLPHFMALKEPNIKLTNAAFWVYNAGIILNIIGWGTGAQPLQREILLASYSLELAGALIFTLGLKIFEKPRTVLNIEGVDNSYAWFIKLAYAWYVISSAMIFLAAAWSFGTGQDMPHFYLGAYRHAFTVGYITTIMMGVGYRVLPIFNGTTLFSNRHMRISFWLIMIGNIARVVFQLGTGSLGKPAFALMGTSGYFEFAALILFSWNIWKTLNYCEITHGGGDVITLKSKVRDILTEHPELRETFVALGFKKLKDPGFVTKIPPFVTLKMACQVEGVDQDKALRLLNSVLSL